MRNYGNFGEGTLATGINAGQGTCTLTNIADLNLPATPTNFWAVIYDDQYHERQAEPEGVGPGGDVDAEIVECYGVSGDVLTIRRGQQGTTPVSHSNPSNTYRVRIIWTATDSQRSQPRVDLRDFDADPTGTNPSTSAIDTAMTQADAAGLELFAPAGTYIVGAISMAAGLDARFQGQGDGRTIFKVEDSTNAAMFGGGSGDIITRLQFRDLTLDGNAANQATHDTSVLYANFNRFVAERCSFINSKRAAYRQYDLQSKAEFHGCRFSGGAVHTGVGGEDTLYIFANQSAVLATPPELIVNDCELVGGVTAGAGRGTGGVTVNGIVDGANVKLTVIDGLFDRLGYNAAGNVSSAIHVYMFGDGTRVIRPRCRRNVNGPIRIQKSTDVRIVDADVEGEDANFAAGGSAIEVSGRSATGGAQIDKMQTVRGCHVRGIPSALYGVYVQGDDTGEQHHAAVEGNTIDGTERGIAVLFGGRSVRVGRNNVENLTGVAAGDESIVVSDLEDGMLVDVSENYLRNCPGRIRINVEGTKREAHVVAKGNVSDDCASTTLGGCIDVDNVASFTHEGNRCPNLPASAVEIEVSNITEAAQEIAGGELTVASWYGARAIQIEVEGASGTDLLHTINGGCEGQIVILYTTDDVRDVTVQDGVGNFNTVGNRGLNLTSYRIALQKIGATWFELSYAAN